MLGRDQASFPTVACNESRGGPTPAALASGTERVTYDGKTVVYRRQADIQAALADVRRQLRGAPSAVLLSTSKGLRT